MDFVKVIRRNTVYLKNGKKSVDNGGTFGALLTGLSKASDC